MTEAFLKDGVLINCKTCFPGRFHLVIDYEEGKFPVDILDAVMKTVNPTGWIRHTPDQLGENPY